MSTIYDTILWLQSQATGNRFPIAQFSGDTDVVTDGWVSLTSTKRPEVVVTQLTAEEYRSTTESSEGYLQAERRINSVLARSDLKCSWLLRVEEVATSTSTERLPFQEFLKVHHSPRLIYRDILSHDSEAEEVGSVTRAEFERNGGNLIVIQ